MQDIDKNDEFDEYQNANYIFFNEFTCWYCNKNQLKKYEHQIFCGNNCNIGYSKNMIKPKKSKFTF